jgi:hypothetical protein
LLPPRSEVKAGFKTQHFQNWKGKCFDISVMCKVTNPGGEVEGSFLQAPRTNYNTAKKGDSDPPPSSGVRRLIWLSTPNLIKFQRLEPSAVRFASPCFGCFLSALDINTLAHLPCLLARFLKLDGHNVYLCSTHCAGPEDGLLVVTNSSSGEHLIDCPIICAKLGARTSGVVEENDVHLIRGQSVLLRPLWADEGLFLVGQRHTSSRAARWPTAAVSFWKTIVCRPWIVVGGMIVTEKRPSTFANATHVNSRLPQDALNLNKGHRTRT